MNIVLFILRLVLSDIAAEASAARNAHYRSGLLRARQIAIAAVRAATDYASEQSEAKQ